MSFIIFSCNKDNNLVVEENSNHYAKLESRSDEGPLYDTESLNLILNTTAMSMLN